MQLLNINESELLAHPLGAKSGREGLMFCCCCFYTFSDFYKTNYLNIYRISIFARFAGLVELWTQMNDLKLFFRSLKGRCGGNKFYGQNQPPIHILYFAWHSLGRRRRHTTKRAIAMQGAGKQITLFDGRRRTN